VHANVGEIAVVRARKDTTVRGNFFISRFLTLRDLHRKNQIAAEKSGNLHEFEWKGKVTKRNIPCRGKE
jgi:hypothetical protein